MKYGLNTLSGKECLKGNVISALGLTRNTETLQNRNAAPKVKKAVPEEKVASLVTSFGAAGTGTLETLGWNGGISGSPPNMSFRTHLRI